MENYLNFKKLVKGSPYKLEREAVWLYLWLLIFEGALRKWFLPGLQQPLILAREPIVLYLFVVGVQRGWFSSPFAKIMMAVSSVSLLASLFVGHGSIIVGLYGWRIYFLHFPVIFVMAKVLTRDDLLKMCRFILWVSIPMTILVLMQFYSPQSAYVNRGIGGDVEGAGFSGANGYFRPPGTFSFISGYIGYQAVVGCVLLYYLMANSTLNEKNRLPKWALLAMAGCYIVSIPTSISRTHFFQTLVFLMFLMIAALRSRRMKGQFIKFAFVGGLALLIVIWSGVADTQLDAFLTRFDQADASEGGTEGTIGNRYGGSFLRGLFNFDLPFWGYGIGLGTNFGARFLGGNMFSFGFNGEEEWSRVTGECGLILGWLILAARLFFSLGILLESHLLLIRRKDLLPWMLSAGVMLRVVNGQWAIPTDLGFAMLFGALALAAVKNSRAAIPAQQPTAQ